MNHLAVRFTCIGNSTPQSVPRGFLFKLFELSVPGPDGNTVISVATTINDLSIGEHFPVIGCIEERKEELKKSILSAIITTHPALKDCNLFYEEY